MSSRPVISKLSGRLWLVFALFVIYGTTIPFNFTTDHDVIALHLSRISPNPFIDSESGGHVSIPDTVQNILLFLPFGVLGVLAGRSDRSRWRRVVLVTALGMGLSVCVETVQLFTRDRITSTSDVMTNTIGAFLGALVAQALRHVPEQALQTFKRAGVVDPKTLYPFLIGLLLVCLAQWEPFDVTLDVSSVFSKFKSLWHDVWQYNGLNDEGVALVQFAFFGAATAAWFQSLKIARANAVALTLAATLAVGLEGSQILISSRMPGLEDALVRAGAVAIGVYLWSLGRGARSPYRWLALVVAATAVGAGIQMLNPFQLAPHRNPLQWLPFMNYYEMTSANTLSHALELLLIYFPMGFCVATVSRTSPRAAIGVTAALVLAIAVPIEYLQGFVVGRFPDVTDPCLSAFGGCIGAWAGSRGADLFRDALESSPDSAPDGARRHGRRPWGSSVNAGD